MKMRIMRAIEVSLGKTAGSIRVDIKAGEVRNVNEVMEKVLKDYPLISWQLHEEKKGLFRKDTFIIINLGEYAAQAIRSRIFKAILSIEAGEKGFHRIGVPVDHLRHEEFEQYAIGRLRNKNLSHVTVDVQANPVKPIVYICLKAHSTEPPIPFS